MPRIAQKTQVQGMHHTFFCLDKNHFPIDLILSQTDDANAIGSKKTLQDMK